MTQYVYLASPVKLPVGSFGLNPVSPDRPNVFQTELDFVHLYFENNYDSNLKRRFSYSSHFSYKHQAAVSSNYLPLSNQIRGTAEEEKCLRLLYAYMENAIQASGVLEYFTSWNGEEDMPIAKKGTIYWSDVKTPYDLVLDDREFLEIFLWE